jgi:hypothetical protein
VRTWSDNKQTINQLWPTCSFTDEEKRLWHDDLGSLDQDVLYDAIRNVKRSRDTQWPQLKWMLDAYRELSHAKRQATRHYTKAEERCGVEINEDENSRLADDFVAYIDTATPADCPAIIDMVLDKLPKMHSRTALRVITYAKKRLLGEEPKFGRVNDNGDVTPFGIGGAA